MGKPGIGAFDLFMIGLQLMLIGLKLTGFIDWAWSFVLAPISRFPAERRSQTVRFSQPRAHAPRAHARQQGRPPRAARRRHERGSAAAARAAAARADTRATRQDTTEQAPRAHDTRHGMKKAARKRLEKNLENSSLTYGETPIILINAGGHRLPLRCLRGCLW